MGCHPKEKWAWRVSVPAESPKTECVSASLFWSPRMPDATCSAKMAIDKFVSGTIEWCDGRIYRNGGFVFDDSRSAFVESSGAFRVAFRHGEQAVLGFHLRAADGSMLQYVYCFDPTVDQLTVRINSAQWAVSDPKVVEARQSAGPHPRSAQ
jgi:hypothetical protein